MLNITKSNIIYVLLIINSALESPIWPNAIILMIGWRPLNVWLCTTAADDDEAHMVKSLNIAGYHNPRWQFSPSSRHDYIISIGGFFYKFWSINSLLWNFINHNYSGIKLSPQPVLFKLFHVGVWLLLVFVVEHCEPSKLLVALSLHTTVTSRENAIVSHGTVRKINQTKFLK